MKRKFKITDLKYTFKREKHYGNIRYSQSHHCDFVVENMQKRSLQVFSNKCAAWKRYYVGDIRLGRELTLPLAALKFDTSSVLHIAKLIACAH